MRCSGEPRGERGHVVACKRCNSSNSLDSKFCRQCGAALPEEDLALALAELDALIAEGFRAFNEGRTEEAMLISASAVESNPSASSAVSLQGMCHERVGEVAEALECYEKVVSLNPGSALDKIKVTQLRNQLAGRSLEVEAPNRRRALAGALSAVVLVVAIGSLAAVLTGNRPKDDLASNDQGAGSLQGFDAAPPGAGAATPEQPAAGTPTPAPGGPPVSPQIQIPAPFPGGVLPRVGDEGTLPVRIDGPIGNPPIARPTEDANRDRTPNGVRQDPVDTELPMGPPLREPPKENPGVIDIRVSTGGPRPSVGGTAPNPNGLEALGRTARQQYQLGKFNDAARSYEQLLKSGGDAASTNQRLGQCYEKLGRKPDALSAYTRAVSAYEAQVKAGKSESQFALDACKQALKVLQGS